MAENNTFAVVGGKVKLCNGAVVFPDTCIDNVQQMMVDNEDAGKYNRKLINQQAEEIKLLKAQLQTLTQQVLALK
ncbi:hypothetical protein [Photobacterium sp. 53610]|uniref:hypothetical protein n=1 Tax=Photobacterium sp. 53610 TaxID=3102789 RepID=UPI002ED9F0A8